MLNLSSINMGELNLNAQSNEMLQGLVGQNVNSARYPLDTDFLKLSKHVQ